MDYKKKANSNRNKLRMSLKDTLKNSGVEMAANATEMSTEPINNIVSPRCRAVGKSKNFNQI